MVSLPVLSILIISMSGLLHVSPADASPVRCCFSHATQQIPRKFVVDFVYTNKLCSNPAVIFTTKKGRQICANPQDWWVQQYVADLTEGRV